jgi:hypothetical protein
MDFSAILALLAEKYPTLGIALVVLGLLVVAAQTYVALTPTQDDDAWFAKLEAIPILGHIIIALKAFAPIQRKEPPAV